MSTQIRYNWEDMQYFYDLGHSIRELTERFGVTRASVDKARNRGDFKPRSLSDAMKNFNVRHPNAAKKCGTLKDVK